jgi:vacuolar-type H+-ATPase subunit E/Vma4
MSLHVILEAIRASGEAKVREIESRAYAQMHEMIANARLEAERMQEQACASSLEPAYRERARIVHRARLEAMQITGNTRKELVDASLEQVRGRLAGFRTDPRYPDVMRNLLREALSELSGSEWEPTTSGSAYLEADPCDRPLLEALLQEMYLNLPVSYTIQCWGGLIACNENGRVVVINTLEARLERAVPYLRSQLAAFLEDESVVAVMDRPLQFHRAKERR